ncbi:MAG: translation elongation factor Ts [Chitinophagales bacterium]|nr:translation elongation factor Ts [Chitinophagales bacterium]MCZ2393681.1 translation elongation factor Ts [Chitinophagales bacterium]
MSISAAEVNKLRQETGAGLMDCKKALVETNGDFEAAIDFLRKKGAKIAANRAEREANEGVVIALTNEDSTFGILLNLSAETDFVAKNEDFIALAKEIAQLALETQAADIEALNATPFRGTTVANSLLDTVAKIGEKIEVKKYETLSGKGLIPYIHMGYRMGVIVELNQSLNEANTVAGKDVAMQIAAMNPIALDASGVSEETKDRERAIAREKAVAAGKPENLLDKIADGAVNSMLKESTLLSQPFVKDSGKTVDQYVKSVDKELKVLSFKRVSLS